LAEYKKNEKGNYEIHCVKSAQIDGNIIKEDTYYCLCGGEFREYLEADGIKSAILNKRGNIYKVMNFGETQESVVINVNGVWAHGNTLKDAKASLMYKISDRDTSEFKDWKPTDKKPVADIIRAYRCITGACEYGTRYFCESIKLPKFATIEQTIELTRGQYGHDKFVEFFKNK
jgi:hypothetical protein